MSTKHKSYKRIHTYNHESDIEKGRIRKEKAHMKKARKKQKRLLGDLLENPGTFDETTLEAYETARHAEKKETGNAMAHRSRLKALTDHGEMTEQKAVEG